MPESHHHLTRDERCRIYALAGKVECRSQGWRSSQVVAAGEQPRLRRNIPDSGMASVPGINTRCTHLATLLPFGAAASRLPASPWTGARPHAPG